MCPARRSSVRPPRWLGVLASVVCGALLVLVAAGAAPPGAGPGVADDTQTLYIRRAFEDDTLLKDHRGDIFVSVRGPTATLTGTLPSEMLKRRALRLARVPGIEEVRDELRVVTPTGEPDVPTPFPDGPPPGELTGRPKGERTTQVPRKTDLPEPDPRPSLADAVSLGQPVPITSSPAAPNRGPAEMGPPRPLAAAPDLSAAVEALRQKEPRWQRVTVEVRQKTVYLRGTVGRWNDVNDLTNAVRRLPGVEAVVLDGLKSDGGR